jgi:hypothetical protein
MRDHCCAHLTGGGAASTSATALSIDDVCHAIQCRHERISEPGGNNVDNTMPPRDPDDDDDDDEDDDTDHGEDEEPAVIREPDE